jgi:hypothetical protein
MSTRKVAYYYDDAVGNYYYGQAREGTVVGSSSQLSPAASLRRLTARARGNAGAPDEAAPHAHDARLAHQV